MHQRSSFTGGNGMATLIVFRTRHGCARMGATRISEGLSDQTTVVDLKRKRRIAIDAYDTVVIGGSIHVGRIQRKVRSFCKKKLDTPLTKRVGLYLCCMQEGEKAQEEFDEAYPEELREHAAVTGIFGGVFDLAKMNAIEKAIVKNVAGVERSVSKINDDAIDAFIQTLRESQQT
jgi:menaquinone-dependent protoporphyrinogen oxidase